MKLFSMLVIAIFSGPAAIAAAQSYAVFEGMREVRVQVPLPAAAAPAGLAALTMSQVYSMNYEALAADLRKEIDNSCDTDYMVANDAFGLTQTEQCVVSNYTTTWFSVVNPGLWRSNQSGSGLGGLGWAYVRVLDKALSKMKSEPEMILYRGTQRQIKFIPGQAAQLKAYSSTSPKIETAQWFIGGDEPRIMVIKARSAKNIMRYTMTGQEEERLLPRNVWVRMERSEMKNIKVFNEETGAEESTEVEFVYLTEVIPS